MRGGWLRSNSRSWEVHSGQYFSDAEKAGLKEAVGTLSRSSLISEVAPETRLFNPVAPIDSYSNLRRPWSGEGLTPGDFSAFPQMQGVHVELGISQFLRLSAKRLASTKSPMIMLS